MNPLPSVPAGDVAAILTELAMLMANTASIGASLERRGFTVSPFADGMMGMPPGAAPDILIVAPLPQPAACSVSGMFVSGCHVAQYGAILATMRASAAGRDRAALLFLPTPLTASSVLPIQRVLAVEGGVSPRIWPSCFGSIDFLIRCIGRQPQRDMPNMALNALEGAIPVLSALQAASVFPPGRRRSSGSPDAPLTPRLSLLAAHGGTRGAPPPTLFDIVATRRYSPSESVDSVTAEIDAVIRGAAPAKLRVELSVLGHTAPVADPTRPRWSLETEALAVGWMWPQTSFRTTPPLVADSILFGGLEEASQDPSLPTAFVSVEEIEALTRSLTHYLSSI